MGPSGPDVEGRSERVRAPEVEGRPAVTGRPASYRARLIQKGKNGLSTLTDLRLPAIVGRTLTRWGLGLGFIYVVVRLRHFVLGGRYRQSGSRVTPEIQPRAGVGLLGERGTATNHFSV